MDSICMHAHSHQWESHWVSLRLLYWLLRLMNVSGTSWVSSVHTFSWEWPFSHGDHRPSLAVWTEWIQELRSSSLKWENWMCTSGEMWCANMLQMDYNVQLARSGQTLPEFPPPPPELVRTSLIRQSILNLDLISYRPNWGDTCTPVFLNQYIMKGSSVSALMLAQDKLCIWLQFKSKDSNS